MAMWVGREEEIPAYRLAHNQEATPATLGLFQACEAGDATKVRSSSRKMAGRTTLMISRIRHAACRRVHPAEDATALEALIAFAKTEPGDDLKPLFDLLLDRAQSHTAIARRKWAIQHSSRSCSSWV